MAYYVPSLENLIDKFESLPSIGRKSAQRLAFYILNMPDESAKNFIDAITEARSKIKYCSVYTFKIKIYRQFLSFGL